MNTNLMIILEFLNTVENATALGIREHFEADIRKNKEWSSLFIPGLVARGLLSVTGSLYRISEEGKTFLGIHND